jgi:hypothetical protein
VSAADKMLQCQTRTSDAAKTSRLTENKRRYRARRKEYVSDLERRLAESRQQEIKATTEVQLAARKVVEENGRLRELLRLAGFVNEDIDVWARREDCGGDADGADCARRRDIERKAGLCAIFTAGHKRPALEEGKTCSSSKSNIMRVMDSAGNISESTNRPTTKGPLVSEPNYSNRPDSDTTVVPAAATNEPPAAAQAETGTCHDKTIMPCKLVSRLAENPAADITQASIRPGSASHHLKDATHHGGDVECGKAYEMLMQYATSEEKLDYIAGALENGCTSVGKGSCVVKKKAVWEALDKMCG